MVYQNKSGKKIGELVEIKPKAQTLIEKAKNQLGYQPVDFLDGIAIMDKQIKKYEI